MRGVQLALRGVQLALRGEQLALRGEQLAVARSGGKPVEKMNFLTPPLPSFLIPLARGPTRRLDLRAAPRE